MFCPLFLFSQELVTIYAVEKSSGKVVINEGGDIGVTPASCMKVLTTGAALHILGPEHVFTTVLEYDGEIVEGSLEGNLYIRGGGDPTLGVEDWEGQLLKWVSAVKNIGISSIKGKVLADASAWETALAPPGWAWEDLGNYYGAGASALSFHKNSYAITFIPGEVGKAPKSFSTNPPQFMTSFISEMTTGPAGSGDLAFIYGSEDSFTQVLRGSIPADGKPFTVRGAIPAPSLYLQELFIKALAKEGVIAQKEELPKGERKGFHKTHSASVAEIVYETNKKSINLYAEHLFKAMGEGKTSNGVQAVRKFWEGEGVDLSGAYIADGSGLSRSNTLSAKQCVEILRKIEDSPHYSVFLDSLPELEGVRAKSGSFSLVRGYIGYSDQLVFAFFITACPDWKQRSSLTKECFKRIQTAL